MKGKGPYITANKINRSSTSLIPEEFLLRKLPYNKRLKKMSDRCIPRLVNIEQLEYLFEGLGKLSINEKGKIQILKIIKEEIDQSILENMKESEATQLKIEINIE